MADVFPVGSTAGPFIDRPVPLSSCLAAQIRRPASGSTGRQTGGTRVE
ncbi:hypothetical protein ACH4MM_06125 [Streptomyces pratensis]